MPHSSSASLTVLLPVRDARPYLAECIASLANQTLGDFRIVAIDDGSSDGSTAILEDWAREDRRVLLERQPPRGHVASLQRGLALCHSEWIARMDADDVCAPERFEKQMALAQRDPDLAVVSCHVEPIGGVTDGQARYVEWVNSVQTQDDVSRQRFVECPVVHPSVLLRRSAVLEAGGYRDVGHPEDYDLWLRLLGRGARFAKHPATLFFWRDHGARLTRRDPRYERQRFLDCKVEHLLAGPCRNVEQLVIWGAGATGRQLNRLLLERGAPVRALIDIDPKKIGGRRRGVPVVAETELDHHTADKTTVLAAVARRDARSQITERLAARGWEDGRSYWWMT